MPSVPSAPQKVDPERKIVKITGDMNHKSKIIKVTLCGPGDVEKEIKIAREVIDKWNQTHWESTGWGLKTQHWNTDAVPTMAERGQAAINHQLIDDSDIIVAVLWTRFGTPTGLAESGTEEEITRAMAREIQVLSYFSDLEAPGTHHDKNQAEKLAAFRSKMMNAALSFTFKSRKQFRELFESHLDAAVRKLLMDNKKEKAKKQRKTGKTIIQKATGNSNVQLAGDGNTLNFKGTSKRPNVTIERSPDHISPADQKRVSDWIKELAEESTGKALSALISEWWSRFYNRFNLTSYKDLRTGKMPDVEAWYCLQLNLIKAGRKSTDPQSWKNAKYRSIKMKMAKMGLAKEDYYPDLSSRLNMKRPFTSLTKLSKHDLERVERCLNYDYEKWRQ
jgi:hypothetical protein